MFISFYSTNITSSFQQLVHSVTTCLIAAINVLPVPAFIFFLFHEDCTGSVSTKQKNEAFKRMRVIVELFYVDFYFSPLTPERYCVAYTSPQEPVLYKRIYSTGFSPLDFRIKEEENEARV